ncbi:hypothetical protein J2847_002947 [Azospirillum agricola]|uniref:hypothetical protein n=1 Tax=Azospirillum agricola TaxID=1720247 RepID=UPI001AE8F29B|nr:hypothetical protein [Azospirillum agricola]MBP2229648.1 hypothetical protein [Azospirillum agricola]
MTLFNDASTNATKEQTVTANAVSIPTGLLVRPVTMTVEAQARRRTDLPDVWTAELELGNGKMLRQHFRETDGGTGLEDVTELVGEILLERARSRKQAERHRQADQVVRVGMVTPERLRRDRGDAVIVEGTMRAGQTRSRALSALGTLNQRNLLTMRQFEAGDRLSQDLKIMTGAKEPREDDAPPTATVDPDTGRSWEDFAVAAARRVDAACDAVRREPPFERVSPWSVIEGVCAHDRPLTEVAGSNARSVLRRYKTALRIGLDRIGDVYSLDNDAIVGRVFHDGIPREVLYLEDRDGPDQDGGVKVIVRTISLNGRPWVAVADSFSEIYDLAKAQLRADGEKTA